MPWVPCSGPASRGCPHDHVGQAVPGLGERPPAPDGVRAGRPAPRVAHPRGRRPRLGPRGRPGDGRSLSDAEARRAGPRPGEDREHRPGRRGARPVRRQRRTPRGCPRTWRARDRLRHRAGSTPHRESQTGLCRGDRGAGTIIVAPRPDGRPSARPERGPSLRLLIRAGQRPRPGWIRRRPFVVDRWRWERGSAAPLDAWLLCASSRARKGALARVRHWANLTMARPQDWGDPKAS
jgi:hypothetical protein